jgi:hypothetical protein
MLLFYVLFCAIVFTANAARTTFRNPEDVKPIYTNCSTHDSALAYAGVARGASSGLPKSLYPFARPYAYGGGGRGGWPGHYPKPHYANFSAPGWAGVARGMPTGYYPPSAVTYTVFPTPPAGATAVETTSGTVIYSMPHGGFTKIPCSTTYISYASTPSTYITSTHHVRPIASVTSTPVTSTRPPATHPAYSPLPLTGAAASMRPYAAEMAVMLGGAVGLAMAL